MVKKKKKSVCVWEGVVLGDTHVYIVCMDRLVTRSTED